MMDRIETQPQRGRAAQAVAAVAVALTMFFAAPASAQSEGSLTQGEQELVDAYTVMQGVTGGLLATTATLGMIQLYNLPTAFGDGACAEGNAIGGDFACSQHLTLVHGALGVLSVGSYTATGILALEAPDLDQGTEDTVTDVLGTATAIGFGLTGLMGILGANPWLVGITDESDQREFSEVVRVIHAVLAVTTASIFASHVMVDHID